MKTERLEIGGSLAFESVKYAVVEGYQTPPGDASFEFIERSPDAWFSDTETSVSIDESTARKLIDALSEHFGVVAQAAQPAQADLQAAFAKGMACRPASAQMPAEPGEKAQPMCTPEEAARICSTLGPVPDGKTWAQHMVDTARTGWVPSTMGHAEYLVEPWPILGWS